MLILPISFHKVRNIPTVRAVQAQVAATKSASKKMQAQKLEKKYDIKRVKGEVIKTTEGGDLVLGKVQISAEGDYNKEDQIIFICRKPSLDFGLPVRIGDKICTAPNRNKELLHKNGNKIFCYLQIKFVDKYEKNSQRSLKEVFEYLQKQNERRKDQNNNHKKRPLFRHNATWKYLLDTSTVIQFSQKEEDNLDGIIMLFSIFLRILINMELQDAQVQEFVHMLPYCGLLSEDGLFAKFAEKSSKKKSLYEAHSDVIVELKEFLEIYAERFPEPRNLVSILCVIHMIEEVLDQNDIRFCSEILNIICKKAKKQRGLLQGGFRSDLMVPTRKELLAAGDSSGEDISSAYVQSRYQNAECYLQIYYNLLRQEAFGSMINQIYNYMQDRPKSEDKVYVEVDFKGIVLQDFYEGGCALALKLSPLTYVEGWQSNPRYLMHGNLVCLLLDGTFQEFVWGTVAHRDDRQLLRQHDIALIEVLPYHSNENTLELQEIVTELSRSRKAVLIESPVYYRAHRPVMQQLQNKSAKDVPFQEEIIHGNSSIVKPKYLDQPDLSVDQRIIFDTQPTQPQIQSSEYEYWPSYTSLDSFNTKIGNLIQAGVTHPQDCLADISQLQAVKNALNKRVCLIQGPPGTGKTRVGTQIVRLLLSLQKKGKNQLDSPIVVITYKNHALDEFLTHLLKYYKEQGDIVRLGGGSMKSQLRNCNLRNLKQVKNTQLNEADAKKLKNLQWDRGDDAKNLEDALHNWQINFNFNVSTFLSGNQEQYDQDADWRDEQIVNVIVNCPWQNLIKDENNLQEKLEQVERVRRDAEEMSQKREISLQSFLLVKFRDLDKDESSIQEQFQTLLEEALQEWKPVDTDLAYISRSEQKAADEQTEKVRDSVIMTEIDDEAVEEELERLSLEQARKDPVTESDIIEFHHESDHFDMLANRHQPRALEKIRKTRDLWSLESLDRGLFIGAILQNTKSTSNDESQNLLFRYRTKCKEINKLEDKKTLQILQQAKVVGVTVTGASIRASLLEQLQPSVILVEEAGEVLEPQLIAPLGSWTQHLVLIGDHKQLRPLLKNNSLKNDAKFDTSMLERLIEKCQVDHSVLKFQGRMKENLAEQLVEVYPHYQNNVDIVKDIPDIKCVQSNLFWWHHNDLEESQEFGTTRANKKEAARAAKLAVYFLQNGYTAEQVTIIAAYKGQVRAIKKELKEIQKEYQEYFTITPEKQTRNSSLRSAYKSQFGKQAGSQSGDEDEDEDIQEDTGLREVRVLTIDSYQGDENDIIIVSFVRSNKDNEIGFLKDQKRMTVALSRAKQGLFLIGNSKCIRNAQNSPWIQFIERLESQGQLKDKITLVCPQHPNFTMDVEDENEVPIGKSVCGKICEKLMPCGQHVCGAPCHEHTDTECTKWIEVTPKCRHYPEHKLWRPCSQSLDNIVCDYDCDEILECGHVCNKLCGQNCTKKKDCRQCIKMKKEKEKWNRWKLKTFRKQKHELDEDQYRIWLKELKKDRRKGAAWQQVKEGSSDYFQLKDMVERSIQDLHSTFLSVDKIYEIVNPALERKWLEYGSKLNSPSRNTIRLFHGTDEMACQSIAEHGFIMPKKSPDNMFGQGIYCAPNSSKSAQQMYTKKSNTLLVCDAWRGKVLEFGGFENPPKEISQLLQPNNYGHYLNADESSMKQAGYNSLFAKRGTKEQKGVLFDEYVFYGKDQVYPRYMIYFTRMGLDNMKLPQVVRPGSKIFKLKNPADKAVVDDSPDALHFRLAESQFYRMTQNRLRVVDIEYCFNRELEERQEKFIVECENSQNSKNSQKRIVFHGTQAQNIPLIVEEGFKVGGEGVPIKRGAASGPGIYTSEGTDLPSGYTEGGNKMLFCQVVLGNFTKDEGKYKQGGYDSYVAGNLGEHSVIVLRSPKQIVPKYIITFQ